MPMTVSAKSLRSLCLTLAVAFALIVAGCSDNPYPPGQTAKNIHYVVLNEPLRHTDPVNSYRNDEAEVIDNIYAEYFKYDYLKRDPFTLDLSLGASEPVRRPYRFTTMSDGKTVSGVGEEWTFHVKPGIHYPDDPCFPGGKGREVVASDFLYAFRRMADPANNCPVVNFVSDKILGFADYMNSAPIVVNGKKTFDYTAPVQGLQLDPKDPYTFRILLNQPYPQLRFLMAMHFTAPIPHEAIEKYGDLSQHPIGCGQFILAEYVPRQRIVLKTNPNRPVEYYPSEGTPEEQQAGLLADAGKRLPMVDEIDYHFISEGTTIWNLFLQGYEDTSGVGNENFKQVVSQQGAITPEMKAKGVSLRKDVKTDIMYYCFNMDDPVFGGYTEQKRKLRQAVSTAIDSQAYIDLFEQGVGLRAQFMLPPGIYGYDPSYQNPYRQFSIARAKQLLVEAGYPDGIDPKTGDRLTLYYDNNATTAAGRLEVELLQKQIEAIGLRFVSRSERDLVWQDHLDNGQFMFARYGWIADYPDPENFLGLFYSKNKRPGPNYCDYNNPAYDKLFEQMRAMNDGPARLAIIKQMRDMLVNDSPMIFGEHDEDMTIHYDWIHNVYPHPIAMDGYQYESVDGVERARKEAEWNRPNYWPIVLILAVIVIGSLPAISVVNRRRTRYIRKGTGGNAA